MQPPPSPNSSPNPDGAVSALRAIDRPIFIVSSPRSGSSLLFETLAKSPSAWTIGGESHTIIESIPLLHPQAKGFASNVLDESDATPEVVERLAAAFLRAAVNRDGTPASANRLPIRLLEKTPKNSLRVRFLNAAFPGARFVYLYREPRETLSSMLDAWKSRRFVTYPQLPGWPGPPWSLLLVPGWTELAGVPLADLVVEQWATATRLLLDDLDRLDPDQWCVASYDRLVDDPQGEVTRLCRFLDLDWDHELTAPLPPARHTLTPPDPDKWRKNMPELAPFLHLMEETAARARAVFGEQPPPRPRRRPKPAEAAGEGGATAGAAPPAVTAPAPRGGAPGGRDATGPPAQESFRSVHTGSLPRLLAQMGSSLLVSTYQSGRVIAVRMEDGRVNTHFRFFPSPMGMALGPNGLLLGTQRGVWLYEDQPAVAAQVPGPTRPDACFLPRWFQATGDIRVHEVAWCGDEAWIVNTRFSCLATLNSRFSFVPRWRPRFITDFVAEDRCHLNGLCVIDGAPAYVTALGTTDTHQGWRERKADGGVIIDVASGEFVARGLSMPHSPRWYQGRLWVLESGKGELNTVDLATGRSETVAQVPGFTRGLAFAGPLAFIGLSQVRESVFGGIPLAQRITERNCGVWVVDTRTGQSVAFLRFEGQVQEIFDVLLLPGLVFPELLEPDDPIVAASYRVPNDVLAAWKPETSG